MLHWAYVKQFISTGLVLPDISGEPYRCSHEWITVKAVQSWVSASEKNVMQLE